jgi:GT2 family glycosyltransferase/DNA-binding beta-propeller fold protein YncE
VPVQYVPRQRPAAGATRNRPARLDPREPVRTQCPSSPTFSGFLACRGPSITAVTISSSARSSAPTVVRVDGKFLQVAGRRFLVKGVAYGTFAPDAAGMQFPDARQLAADFSAIAAAGFNTVRTYTVPSAAVLDAAAREGLRVMVGMPWPQHMAFLDDQKLVRRIRRDAMATVCSLAAHPAVLMLAVGNEISPAVVRWHGPTRIQRFLRSLYDDLKSAAPESVLTYVNFPPTEHLDLSCFDVCAFNVYLHREADLRRYLARLQHIAGPRPLLLAEAGGDSRREGEDGQARITSMHVRTAFEEGACGAVAFSWTDEWWRGGHDVNDWAFGLVDANRCPKAALAAVTRAFAEAPFSTGEVAARPKVSVVVCAHDAAGTIDECLASLAALAYPNVEIIVVNDGSRDATAAIARAHAGVRVIDIPKGGLSVARNVGLAAASGEIVAYTDADVRVDPDWLNYLVHTLLTADVVGVGGPNVVPDDDGWMAQCVARAPGGPTHVLLDDTVAEHIPGCNMAFRREALLSIGGFNPVFVRAGDDVDICWRLQARGLRLGFAPAALVWHRHRTTIEGFWRQQVGYGEAEAWLHVHHPEKCSGGRILWRGRIYSPLPQTLGLRGRRVNTGVWGTAAFPSVYWTAPSPWQHLAHSVTWIVLSTILIVMGAFELAQPFEGEWLLAAGTAGWLTTLARCVALAQRSDLRKLPRLWGLPFSMSRVIYRAVIASLHVVQPLARMRGRLKGMWSLPQTVAPPGGVPQPWQASIPSFGDAGQSIRLMAGLVDQRAFWSESWFAHPSMLSELAAVLRASRPAQVVELDDGWHADRDLSVAVGHWGWLDLRVLVEEHAEGRCIVRVGSRFRFGPAGLAAALALIAMATLGAAATVDWPAVGASLVAVAGGIAARAAWRTGRAVSIVRRGLARVSGAAGFVPLAVPSPWSPRIVTTVLTPARLLQAAVVILAIALIGVGRRPSASADEVAARGGVVGVLASEGSVAVGIAGDVFVADAQTIRRLRPRPPLGALWRAEDIATDGDPILGAPIPFGATDIALAPNGDLFVADARRNRISRVVPSTGAVDVVAESLHGPSAVALGPNGDLYVADTLDNRIRLIPHDTAVSPTVAGDGRAGGDNDVGDGGAGVSAQLLRPTGLAVAHNGDVYIADTGHHRIRLIRASTGIISTIAGDGVPGMSGDGALAVAARLAAPAGLSLVSGDGGLFLYVADTGNNRVRVIDPAGRISTVSSQGLLIAPTRIAYHPAGWLYVKDASRAGVTALSVSPSAPNLRAHFTRDDPPPPKAAASLAAARFAREGGRSARRASQGSPHDRLPVGWQQGAHRN